MAKPLDFKDFMAVDYMPGEDGIIKKAAKKRKQDTPTGNTGESTETNEALTAAQRRKRALQFKKYKSRIKIGRERAERKIASPEKLKKRARKQARLAVMKKLVKDVPKDEMSFAKRQEIEKRLDKPAAKAAINRVAKKLLPKIRKAEMTKKRGG
jgi:hypothetical protein